MLNEEAKEYFRGEGRKGGNKTKERYGKEYFVELGRKSGEARRKKLSLEENETSKGVIHKEDLTDQ